MSLRDGKVVILEPVFFKSDKDQIDRRSFALLDKIGGSRLMRLKNEPHLGYSTTH